MSLSGGTAGGKGVDSNAVDTYDSGDEWDIGVGNLIIDLDADLEKDKLEMSVTKDGMAAPPSAVAALPDNIRFVSPVSGSQGKESKSKYKRSKNSKDNSSKASSADGGKKETTGRTPSEPTGTAASTGAAGNNATSGKNMEKGGKAPRGVLSGKKDKEGVSGKNKKDKTDGAPVAAMAAAEKDVISQTQLSLGSSRNASFENAQSTDLAEANPMGNIALESVGIVPALAAKAEPEEVENGNGECKTIKKVKNEKVNSVFTRFPVHCAAKGNYSLWDLFGKYSAGCICERKLWNTGFSCQGLVEYKSLRVAGGLRMCFVIACASQHSQRCSPAPRSCLTHDTKRKKCSLLFLLMPHGKYRCPWWKQCCSQTQETAHKMTPPPTPLLPLLQRSLD